jgi:hypothetical protein
VLTAAKTHPHRPPETSGTRHEEGRRKAALLFTLTWLVLAQTLRRTFLRRLLRSYEWRRAAPICKRLESNAAGARALARPHKAPRAPCGLLRTDQASTVLLSLTSQLTDNDGRRPQAPRADHHLISKDPSSWTKMVPPWGWGWGWAW